MLRTIKIKLERSNDLLQTIRIFNCACQEVLDYGFGKEDYNKTRLNKGTYHQVRKQYPTLPSALVQTARDQASDMLKRSRKASRRDKDCETYFKYKPVKKELSAIRYDKRTMKVFLENNYCTITTVFGRMRYDFKLAEYYHQYLDWQINNAQLVANGKGCYLHVQIETETPELKEGDKRLGIDLGINNIAVCSDNTFYNSKHLKNIKGKYRHLKGQLQTKGTRSAKRKLKRIRERERRFVKDLNHCLAKEIVNKPYDIFVFENLTNIKKSANKGRRFNRKLGRWSYAELQKFVEYKSEPFGKKVLYVNPKYTSQTCSKCGYRAKNNRNGKSFKCKQCSFELNADLNASRNIATLSRSVSGRLSVNQPNVALATTVTSPHSSEVGN